MPQYKITKVTLLGGNAYTHICPVCGKILVSACQRDMLPEYSYCQHYSETAPDDYILDCRQLLFGDYPKIHN